jgi:hypothetical protein
MFFFQSRRLGHKVLIRGSADTKLALNQDFKHGKEDYVSQKNLMLKFMKLNEAKRSSWHENLFFVKKLPEMQQTSKKGTT